MSLSSENNRATKLRRTIAALCMAGAALQTSQVFAADAPAAGEADTSLDEVIVTDSFGQTWPLAPPADWSLFATDGLDPRALVVWATAAQRCGGRRGARRHDLARLPLARARARAYRLTGFTTEELAPVPAPTYSV